MGRSALESSPHQKTHKVDQIHVARLDLLSARCGTPDRYAGRQVICRVSPVVLSPMADLGERLAVACDGQSVYVVHIS